MLGILFGTIACLHSGLAYAQSQNGSVSGPTSVTSIFFIEADQQPLVASVVDASQSKITYVVGCPPDTDGSDCGVYGGSVTVAPSAWDMTETDADYSYSAHCDFSGTVPGLCTEANVGSGANDPGTSTFSPGTDSGSFMPVTITTGLEKLASATASSTGGKTSSASSGSAMPAGSVSTGSVRPTTTSAGTTGAVSPGSAASSSSTTHATGAANNNGGSGLLEAVVGMGAAVALL